MYDLIIKNGKLVTPDRVYEADIAVKDGKYAAFLAPGTEAEATEVIDAEGNLVYPGIIDCHAHLDSITEKTLKRVQEQPLLQAVQLLSTCLLTMTHHS